MKRPVYHQTYMQLYAYTTHYSLPYAQSPSNRPSAYLCSSRITLTPLCSSNFPSQLLCDCVGGLASGICHTRILRVSNRNCVPWSQWMANQMIHCAFSCMTATILTATVAVLISAESSPHVHGVCANVCVCVCMSACLRTPYELIIT
jgi:hypothetical protein